MNKLIYYSRFSLVLLSISSLIFAAIACEPEEKPDPKEKERLDALTAKTWTAISATLDNQGRTDAVGLTFKVTGPFNRDNPAGPYSYSTAGNKPLTGPWPAAGFLMFGTNPLTQLTRDDGVEIAYGFLNNGHLLMTFRCTQCNYAGRTSGVNGVWTFEFE
jgi:hypothetical protein